MRLTGVLAFTVALAACSPVDAGPSGPPAAALPVHQVRLTAEGATVQAEAGDEVRVQLPSDADDWLMVLAGNAGLETLESNDPTVVRLVVVGAGKAQATFHRKGAQRERLRVVVVSR